MDFKTNSLNESFGQNSLSFKNDYLSVNIIEENNSSKITVDTGSDLYEKHYNYSKKRALYEFNKHFNYSNQLTPYKLVKNGFKKHAK